MPLLHEIRVVRQPSQRHVEPVAEMLPGKLVRLERPLRPPLRDQVPSVPAHAWRSESRDVPVTSPPAA